MGGGVTIIPPAEHSFEHTLVSLVTPESIILYFSSIMRQTLLSFQGLSSRDTSIPGSFEEDHKMARAGAIEASLLFKSPLVKC